MKAVRLHLEEGMDHDLVCQEFGINPCTFRNWIYKYRKYGESGVVGHSGKGKAKPKIPVQVKAKIVELKKENGPFGIQKISDMLRRFFSMKASPETVRKTLHEHKLLEKKPPRKKSQRNMVRPRFFERSTPNQMWQSDIFTFRLGGRYAYLIGFIDDHSRYITGLGLYMAQTAENVLEVYRKAVTEYGVPKEMLTDNGRQYTAWRGTTRFEQELEKDRVKHIRSQPHHPMTLGKIERFWKTIFQDFLNRAQFANFEEARERISCWVQFYNHKRPHQGIDGICPADRFFGIQSELRKVIEEKIKENTLELALRGKPAETFYMVGRMGGQSVVLTAEKGKMKLSVDGKEKEVKNEEFIHELGKRSDEGKEEGAQELHADGEGQGRAVGVVGAAQSCGGVQGDVDNMDAVQPVAEPVDEGYVLGAGEQKGPGEMSSDIGKAGEAHGTQERNPEAVEDGKAPGETPAGEGGAENCIATEKSDDRTGIKGEACRGDDPGGPEREDKREEGSGKTPDVAEKLLQVGEACPWRDARCTCTKAFRTPGASGGGSGEACPGEKAEAPGGGEPEAAKTA
jgi:transposase InsO family protein